MSEKNDRIIWDENTWTKQASDIIEGLEKFPAHSKIIIIMRHSQRYEPNLVNESDLKEANIDVLFDDRKVRAGFMFSDMELIGIPHRIVIGDRGLDSNTIEYRARTDSDNREIALDKIVDFIKEKTH